MSGFEIAAAIFLGLGILLVIYAVVRVTMRLRSGDIESAGSDGDTFSR